MWKFLRMCSKIRDFFKKCIAFSQKVQYNNTCVEKMHGFLAQLAEHLTLNQGVQGSNPWRPISKVLFSMLEEHWGWCFFYAIRVWYWNYIFVNVSAGLHKWNIPRFLVQTISMNLWKQKSCASMGFTISWVSFPLHKKKRSILHLCSLLIYEKV